MAIQVDLKDENAAKNWVRKADNLNNVTEGALKNVNNVLKDIKEGASGELIIDLETYSNQCIEGFNSVMKGFSEMLKAVTGALNRAGDIIKDMRNIVKTASRKI